MFKEAKRNDKFYLKDILDSIEKIESYINELDFEKFSKSQIVIDAVIRNFEIIGEATKNLSKEIKYSYLEIPWKEMTGMRDKVVHEYFGINLKIIWKTIKEKLPELKIKIKEILKT